MQDLVKDKTEIKNPLHLLFKNYYFFNNPKNKFHKMKCQNQMTFQIRTWVGDLYS